MKRSIKFIWISLLLSIIVFNVLIFAIDKGYMGFMPKMEDLENPKSSAASEMFAGDGSSIGKLYLENREPVTYSEISPNVLNALTSTEDERFYEHSGIDAKAIGRAIVGVVTFNPSGGASTLTQQLAKQLLSQGSKNIFTRFIEKLKEQIIAVKLEKNLTKQEIITLYLNIVPFGNNAFGIKMASKTFFNKLPKDLAVEEAAVLVGMLKATTTYNPLRHPKESKARRNVVLDQMVKNFKLTSSQAEQLKPLPIKTDYIPIEETQHEGMAPYFRQVVEQDVKAWCKKKKLNIYADGLKIYTSIDPIMQEYAERAVEKHMYGKTRFANSYLWKKHQKTLMNAMRSSQRFRDMKAEGLSDMQIMTSFNSKTKMKVFSWNAKREKDTTITPMDSIKYMKGFMQTGFLCMDPATGEIKAWVGGINHKYFQFDHCNYNTRRQVGSTMKPLLYCLAVDNGYSPCMTISAAKVFFPGHGWYNPGGSSRGAMPMKIGLAKSINNVAANIIKMVGVKSFVEFAKKLGIVSPLHEYPSVALGADDISIIEMLRSYTMFPNYGINTKPVYISRIEDRNGNLLENFIPERKEVINEITAYKMIKMMQGTVNFGTAKRLKPGFGVGGEIAGKTGTTNDEADAWFIGYTPQLLAGCWVGCEDRFVGVGLGEGSKAAMPIWGYFFKSVQNDKKLGYAEKLKFDEPEIMKGMNECDGVDEISRQRAGATHNVSVGIPDPVAPLDNDESESQNNSDGDKNNGNADDYK
jgi:penicillin-binding protein 1A